MLVVSAVPAVPSNPGERTLYHPGARPTSRIPPTGRRATTSTEYVALVLFSQSSRELLRYSDRPTVSPDAPVLRSHLPQDFRRSRSVSADAAVTATTRSNPKLSTMICRFLPVIFLPPS